MVDSPFAITVQAVGTLMVAALLWQLTKLIPGRFLRYWALGWICLTWALFALRMTKAQHVLQTLTPLGYCLYMLGEFVFGFCLWAGFRDYAHDQPVVGRDLLVFIVILPLSLLSPWLMPEDLLLPTHTVFMAAFFAAAFVSSLQIRSHLSRAPVGLNIVRVMLAGLAAIFFLYGPLLFWSRYVEPLDWQYLRLSPIYDALIELGLAFGMVILASDRAQEALEAKNRELAEVSRRDALTGLFNRRHFDEWVRESSTTGSGALAIIDVNDLKMINDRYLHDTGDAVLKLVARALVARFRVNDPIFRLGGDEFCVLMPGGNEADLASRMADVDDALMNLRIPGVPEPTDIRIAWGVVGYDNTSEIPTAYQNADKAMYASKARRKALIHR